MRKAPTCPTGVAMGVRAPGMWLDAPFLFGRAAGMRLMTASLRLMTASSRLMNAPVSPSLAAMTFRLTALRALPAFLMLGTPRQPVE
jgi:hypothetical protein